MEWLLWIQGFLLGWRECSRAWQKGGCTTLQMLSCCGIAHFTMINLKSCAFCLTLRKERMKPNIIRERGQWGRNRWQIKWGRWAVWESLECLPGFHFGRARKGQDARNRDQPCRRSNVRSQAEAWALWLLLTGSTSHSSGSHLAQFTAAISCVTDLKDPKVRSRPCWKSL